MAALVGMLALLAITASATLTTLPIGGNDSATLQTWAFPQTVYTNMPSTNAPNGIDISQFNEVTVYVCTTNASALAATNTLTVYRALDNSGLTTETTSYFSKVLTIPANSYYVWQTNLVAADIAGQGFLFANLTSTASTNGAGGAGYTFTNTFPFQAGVMEKIKHSLR